MGDFYRVRQRSTDEFSRLHRRIWVLKTARARESRTSRHSGNDNIRATQPRLRLIRRRKLRNWCDIDRVRSLDNIGRERRARRGAELRLQRRRPGAQDRKPGEGTHCDNSNLAVQESGVTRAAERTNGEITKVSGSGAPAWGRPRQSTICEGQQPTSKTGGDRHSQGN